MDEYLAVNTESIPVVKDGKVIGYATGTHVTNMDVQITDPATLEAIEEKRSAANISIDYISMGYIVKEPNDYSIAHLIY